MQIFVCRCFEVETTLIHHTKYLYKNITIYEVMKKKYYMETEED